MRPIANDSAAPEAIKHRQGSKKLCCMRMADVSSAWVCRSTLGPAKSMPRVGADAALSSSTRAQPSTLPLQTSGAEQDAGTRTTNASRFAAQGVGLVQRLQRYNSQAAAAQSKDAPSPAQPVPDNESDSNQDPESLSRSSVPRSTFLLLILRLALAVHYVVLAAGAFAIPTVRCSSVPSSDDLHAKSLALAQAIQQRCNNSMHVIHNDDNMTTNDSNELPVPFPTEVINSDEPLKKSSCESDDSLVITVYKANHNFSCSSSFSLDNLQSYVHYDHVFIVLNQNQTNEFLFILKGVSAGYLKLTRIFSAIAIKPTHINDVAILNKLAAFFSDFNNDNNQSFFVFNRSMIYVTRGTNGKMFDFKDLWEALNSYTSSLQEMLELQNSIDGLAKSVKKDGVLKKYDGLHDYLFKAQFYTTAHKLNCLYTILQDVLLRFVQKLDIQSQIEDHRFELKQEDLDKTSIKSFKVMDLENKFNTTSEIQKYTLPVSLYQHLYGSDSSSSSYNTDDIDSTSSEEERLYLPDETINGFQNLLNKLLKQFDYFQSIYFYDKDKRVELVTPQDLDTLATFRKSLEDSDIKTIDFFKSQEFHIKSESQLHNFNGYLFKEFLANCWSKLQDLFLKQKALHMQSSVSNIAGVSNIVLQDITTDEQSEFHKAVQDFTSCQKKFVNFLTGLNNELRENATDDHDSSTFNDSKSSDSTRSESDEDRANPANDTEDANVFQDSTTNKKRSIDIKSDIASGGEKRGGNVNVPGAGDGVPNSVDDTQDLSKDGFNGGDHKSELVSKPVHQADDKKTSIGLELALDGKMD